ncbi:hypothetical protein BDR05DRAFT_1045825 [Suillus weaverae]|nr:hypothetical protein BDR05DRAFT_1045825 [Suillus weaverae]
MSVVERKKLRQLPSALCPAAIPLSSDSPPFKTACMRRTMLQGYCARRMTNTKRLKLPQRPTPVGNISPGKSFSWRCAIGIYRPHGRGLTCVLFRSADALQMPMAPPVKDSEHLTSRVVLRYLTAHLSTATQHRGIVTDVVSLPGKEIICSVWKSLLSPAFLGNLVIETHILHYTPRSCVNALVHTAVLVNSIDVPLDNTFVAYTPEDKDTAIAALQARGHRAYYIGDVTNYGPELSS